MKSNKNKIKSCTKPSSKSASSRGKDSSKNAKDKPSYVGKGKSRMAKKATSDSDDDPEYYCLVCVEPFSNSRDREK